jgi:glutamate---cysteine ligase / carboxylate-amine ligase
MVFIPSTNPAGSGCSSVGSPTIGVEEEFLLVDPGSGAPRMCNAAVATAGQALEIDLQFELAQCQIETATPVCATISDLCRELHRARSSTAAAAAQVGARLLAAAVPVVGPQPRTITDLPRYHRLADYFGSLAEHVICGCHVHVGVPDRDIAVLVSNHLRPWMPALLALTANSPVITGRDTGYASWRHMLWTRWPSAGPPPHFRSAHHYDEVVATMLDYGSILDTAMIYWDIRLSAHQPTIEIRVSDVPATVQETVLLATLVRGLVVTAQASIARGELAPPVDPEVLRAAYWRAARYGLDGDGVDVRARQVIPASALLSRLFAHTRAALEETGDYTAVRSAIEAVDALGNGARRQKRALRAGAVTDVLEVVTVRPQ